MDTLIQKIHVEEQNSFACRKYRTPQFETNWHKHEEYELIVITEGQGTALIGDYVGEYKRGDVFFLASNIPHWFRKSEQKMIGSAIVVHFLKDFWGSSFLLLPEMKKIRQLLEGDNNGLQLCQSLQKKIAEGIEQIEKVTGVDRIQLLLNNLHQMSQSKQYKVITKSFDKDLNQKENSAIDKIFTYSFKHFLQPVTLEEVAAEASMSIPTFCRFFKRNIKKSYFDFLKELRIGHACKLLRESNDPIIDICYNSGYNSWAHFSKQFKIVKEMTPNQYRKQFKITDEP
jgi:AraC-like DNA-binding protein